jgi:hypothetical protein
MTIILGEPSSGSTMWQALQASRAKALTRRDITILARWR